MLNYRQVKSELTSAIRKQKILKNNLKRYAKNSDKFTSSLQRDKEINKKQINILQTTLSLYKKLGKLYSVLRKGF